MISIERVKKLLDDPNLSDKEVEEIRDGFLILAEIIYERWVEGVGEVKNQDENNDEKSIHHK